ncbi:hypothetical protein TRFO_37141 [Tritrichomonas foetus]|uniref:Uncharacterized protein n=1 Tax=Tritrichomonas foetus TaxID=1144522 RepID=A0A1J4JGR5_9EUKA|nr:hypothetical protein TRFO_37141 [Tritrichomonas foetus]|eukprot:OHS96645.1 hypothetical protein TRFO_37141 [Tritrichomonas foetus]
MKQSKSKSSLKGESDHPKSTSAAQKQINEEQSLIINSKHPFEISGVANGKSLTMTQKAIICCMNLQDGSASEIQILKFLRKHWQFIRKNSSKDYRDSANTRLLHINFRTKKNGMTLFVETEPNSGIWKCNTNCDDSPNEHAKFENSLLDVFRSRLCEEKNGFTLDELVEKSSEFINSPGYFYELNNYDPTGKRRIRAMLSILVNKKELSFDINTNQYNLRSNKKRHHPSAIVRKNEMPDAWKKVNIRDISIDEMYKHVKKNSNNHKNGQT